MDKYKASCYHAKFWIRLLNALYLEDQCFTYFLALCLEIENLYSSDCQVNISLITTMLFQAFLANYKIGQSIMKHTK